MDVGRIEGDILMELRGAALAKIEQVATEMESRKLKAAAGCLREGIGETPPTCCPSSQTGIADASAPTT